MKSPVTMAYPPRRVCGLTRWLLLAVGIVGLLFYMRNLSLSTALNSVHEPVQVTPAHLPTIPTTPQTSNPPNVLKPADAAKQVPEGVIVNPLDPAVKPLVPIQEDGAAKKPEPPIAKPIPEIIEQPLTTPKTSDHPINTLIQAAEKIHADLLKKESKDLKSAAAEYRKRRGRHPPPGFDQWFKFAQENNAIIVEEFWDQIYHDLGPFWGLPPATMRKEAWDFEMNINIRNKNASTKSGWFWTQIWLNLTQTIEHLLPDMDIALNAMDEPRIVLPWEQINKYMEIERSTRHLPPPEEVVSDFTSLSSHPDPEVKPRSKNWAQTCMLRFSSTTLKSN